MRAYCCILLTLISLTLTGQSFPRNGDFNFSLKAEARVLIGTKGAVSISANLATGVSQRIGNFLWATTAAISLYQGGVGSVLSSQNRNARGINQFNTDVIFTGSATLGKERSRLLPLHTFNHNYPAIILNGYQYSLTHAQNFILNFRGRHQRLGTYAIKIDRVYVQSYNDVDLFLGDGDDRFWTGGGSISVYVADGYYLTLGMDVFTGERNPMRTSHSQNPPRGFPYLDYDQSPRDQQWNIGKLFLQLNTLRDDFNFEISSTGRRNMAFQDFIHKLYGTPYFESTAVNQWNIGVGIQHYQD